MTTPACSRMFTETDWTQGRSVSAPALQQIHIWSQFLPQSVTIGTKFVSELQGVEEFTSYSLLEKKKKKRLGNLLGNWKMKQKKKNLRKNGWEDLPTYGIISRIQRKDRWQLHREFIKQLAQIRIWGQRTPRWQSQRINFNQQIVLKTWKNLIL